MNTLIVCILKYVLASRVCIRTSSLYAKSFILILIRKF